MEEKALTVWRRDSWDKQWRDRVSPELDCHQPIPRHDHRGESIHSLGLSVPLFLRTTGCKAKLWQRGSFAASAGHTAGEKGGGTAERGQKWETAEERSVWMGRNSWDLAFCKQQLWLCFRGSGARRALPGTCMELSPLTAVAPFTWCYSGTGLCLAGDHRVGQNLAKISCDKKVMEIIYKALCWHLSSSEALTFL